MQIIIYISYYYIDNIYISILEDRNYSANRICAFS